MAETPKKVVGNNCFLSNSPLIPSGRVPVFGKSSVGISGVIKKAVEIDVSLFSSSDRRRFLFSPLAPYPAPFDSPHFLLSFRVQHGAFASKTFAHPKKTPALQAIQILASSMAETPKKVVGNNCFLSNSPLIPSGRVPVFGKSSVGISGVIKKAVEIDVSLFSSSDRLYTVTVN